VYITGGGIKVEVTGCAIGQKVARTL